MENVLEFYLLATKLKYIIRSGWNENHWEIKADRLESIAEHIYGTCILAIAMESEYKYDINLEKVIKMLVVHELEEVLIGDITPFDGVSAQEKIKMGHEAIREVLKPLLKQEEYITLIEEFDAHETKESIFAYHCDKLEANLQLKYYQDNDFIKEIKELKIYNTEKINQIYEEGDKPYDIWYKNDEVLFNDDSNFEEIHKYAGKKNMKF